MGSAKSFGSRDVAYKKLNFFIFVLLLILPVNLLIKKSNSQNEFQYNGLNFKKWKRCSIYPLKLRICA